MTGGGEINLGRGVANFGFVAQMKADGPSGQFEYENHATEMNVHSESITNLSISGNTATFSGTCKKDKTPCSFTVTVQDNGEPGTRDQFIISIDGGPTEGGVIAKGNIQIHKAGKPDGDDTEDSQAELRLTAVGPTSPMWRVLTCVSVAIDSLFSLRASGEPPRDKPATNQA